MKAMIGILLFTCGIFLACGGSGDSSASNNDDAAKQETVAQAGPDGSKIYKTYCVSCHGIDGAMGLNGAKPIGESILTIEERITLITEGKNTMTPFGGILKEDEIKAVAEYSTSIGE